MSKGKIFAGVCCVAVSVLMLMIGSSPKTISQFIDHYNKEIETFATEKNLPVSDFKLKKDSYPTNGQKKIQKLFDGNMIFEGREYNDSFIVEVRFNENMISIFGADMTSDIIFSFVKAAIMATDEDYDMVMKSMGVSTYNEDEIRNEINGGDIKSTTFNGKRYTLSWPNEFIIFYLEVPK